MSNYRDATNTSLVAASAAKAEGFEETAKALLSIARQFADAEQATANIERARELMRPLNKARDQMVFSGSTC
jgi:uncharacterized protein HemY